MPASLASWITRRSASRPSTTATYRFRPTPDNEPEANRWFWRDADALARSMFPGEAVRVAPFVLEAEKGETPGGWPEGGQTRLDLPNNHLQYAITWFLLAAALLGVYGAYVWKAMAGGRSRQGESGSPWGSARYCRGTQAPLGSPAKPPFPCPTRLVLKFVSTRGEAPALPFEGVLLAALARDGGLYLPETWPRFPPRPWMVGAAPFHASCILGWCAASSQMIPLCVYWRSWSAPWG